MVSDFPIESESNSVVNQLPEDLKVTFTSAEIETVNYLVEKYSLAQMVRLVSVLTNMKIDSQAGEGTEPALQQILMLEQYQIRKLTQVMRGHL